MRALLVLALLAGTPEQIRVQEQRSAFLEIGQREERVMPRTLVALEDAGYLQSEDTGNPTRWTLTAKGRGW